MLLVAMPLTALFMWRGMRHRTEIRIVSLLAFIISCLASLPVLAWAPVYLTDRFEGPGIWLFFAVIVRGCEMLLLLIAGLVALLGRSKAINAANNSPEGIRHPADGLPKPSA